MTLTTEFSVLVGEGKLIPLLFECSVCLAIFPILETFDNANMCIDENRRPALFLLKPPIGSLLWANLLELPLRIVATRKPCWTEHIYLKKKGK